MAEDLPGVPNTHFLERDVIRHEPYIQTVEAAVMKVAFEIIKEPKSNRRSLAHSLIFNPVDRRRFAESFAWWGLHQDAIRTKVFVAAGNYRPDQIHGDVLRKMVRDSWDVAANMAIDPE